ncbi:MAG: hypothetical protein NZM43_13650 [Saprospiraceae bacterium]|nr:hypothetical protein [Saprospiraceae bacterium]MDW8485359.1 hypothetical protein [Saprospiraceae bacterium]
MIEQFKEAYAYILKKFGFNHANTVAMAQIIRATFGHDGAQAVVEVNREHNTLANPVPQEAQAPLRTFFASGARKQQPEENFTPPAQAAGEQQNQAQTTSPTTPTTKPKRGHKSNTQARDVAEPAVDDDADAWPPEDEGENEQEQTQQV